MGIWPLVALRKNRARASSPLTLGGVSGGQFIAVCEDPVPTGPLLRFGTPPQHTHAESGRQCSRHRREDKSVRSWGSCYRSRRPVASGDAQRHRTDTGHLMSVTPMGAVCAVGDKARPAGTFDAVGGKTRPAGAFDADGCGNSVPSGVRCPGRSGVPRLRGMSRPGPVSACVSPC